VIWEIDEKTETIEGLDAAGRPDPAYATALGLLRAPFGRRSLAFVVDIAIWVLLQLPLWIGAVPLLLKLATGSISPYGFLNHPDFVLAVVMASISTVLSLVLLVVQLVLHGRRGVTIGKAVAGIRSVNVRTLERPKVAPVLLRYLVVAAAGIVPVLGSALMLASPTFDPDGRGRGLHDKAAGIWLVDVRKGLNPYDEKRMRVARKMVKADPRPERSALPSLATPVDPSVRPEYRPGGRVSAGVLGVARPHDSHDRPAVGLSLATPTADADAVPGEAGKPILGGYRAPDAERPSAPAMPVVPAAPVVQVPPAPAAPAPVAPAPAVPVPVVPAPVAPAPAAPAAASAPTPPPAAPAPAARPARFALHLDTGETLVIEAPVLLGRNPDAAPHPGAHAVPLHDDTRSLSKTHMLVRPVDGGLEVIDLHSTNGSALIRGGIDLAMPAGTVVATTEGDSIRLGDRVFAVVRA
jgi:uncharacterized RDD family membrane protein YckC